MDRDAVVAFRFDDTTLHGFAGDSLASALLANGVDVVAPSPLLGRPRGVMAAGVEEPGAFVEVTEPYFDAIAPATTVELVEGLAARARAGVGRLPMAGDRAGPSSEHRNVHVETLVVGAGRTGLRAAAAASGGGDRVMVVDEGFALRADVRQAAAALSDAPDATVLLRATALGVYDDGYVVVHERARPRERVWHVRARRVVLATGAHERPIVFRDNDLPGVMLASAARAYVERFGVLPGRRAVVFTNNDSAYGCAATLRAAGAEVVAIVDCRPAASAPADGIPVLAGWTVTAAQGASRVARVRVTDGASERDLDADLVAVSGGWNPVVGLWRALGGGLRYDEDRSCFVPGPPGPPWIEVVGRAGGDVPAAAPLWFVPADDLSRHFVDLQRDATVADIAEALDAGLRSAEHVKRYTYIGTSIDQGRTSGVVAAEVVNQLLGSGPGAQGPTNARPPYTPVSFATLAGRARGRLFDPARTTPIHRWHVEHGAVFENVGQWKRPWYFPRPGDDMEAAVARECLAVRTGAGIMDASTLGKVEVVGPDAAEFLDRMYTNKMSSLAVGSIRYGMMLGVDGMVLDDGVAMRLGEDRFLFTTTTGGAARVLDHCEEWLQTEWPHLRAYCTSVTEQWATVAVAGPRARAVLAALGTDIDLSVEAFPWMTFREGNVAGIPARVARVSFSGELAFEVNVAGWHGLPLWEAAMEAGRAEGLTPYGTETMHVLRAEKGYVIVGQDTDGTVTPHDLGMSWIVSTKKGDFVGRRSLRRPDTARRDRRHLVGLLPDDPQTLLPEGAQLVAEEDGSAPPVAMVGHVTSSYRSPSLGRTFALALVDGGRELTGRTLYAPLPEGTIAATVTEPVFYDPEGARRDG
ncbi:MAG TPA: glycine cleavage T C-terminal barrel domain-containing protein [Actinomycetota bacterium]|nr:glycine cleavage T C-terminal barrel domain-containing protein [Actinomycetota bacterium]